MQEVFRILISMGVLALGFPIGILLAQLTKDELKQGRPWFKLIIILSFIGAVISLIFENDAFFFSCLFFAAVTSMSLKSFNKVKTSKRKNKLKKPKQ